MSSISVNASDPGLASFFQKLSGNVQSPAAGSAPNVDPTTTASDAASTATAQATQAAGGHHHGHHGGGGLFAKVQSAVTSALQSAQEDGSSDPNQVIQDAIAKVFQQSGATPAAGAAAPQGQDGDQDASSQTATSASSAKQAFLQTLQSFGVDASQFHSDFLAAVKSAQSGGEADPSTVLGNFPPGSGLDTTA